MGTKRILIVNNNMHIGGVQKSLVNLLKEIAPIYDVTLLLFYPAGELLKDVPETVSVITSSAWFQTWGMTAADAKTSSKRVLRSFFAAVTHVFGRKWAIRLQVPFTKKISGYDVAISFLHSGDPHAFYGGCNEFVLHCVDAPQKITFLHCDYGKIHGGCGYNEQIYQRFDKIAACSDGCRQEFLNIFPWFSEKTVVVKNCHDYAEIRRLAEDRKPAAETGLLKIITVARFGREKGVLRGIQAIGALGEQKAQLQYAVIGNGVEFEKAQMLVRQLRLQDTVFLLGENANPYGQIAAADVLLIPSVSEAAPMVIGEAACLGTPILTTATSSAEEMVAETGYGWVCENSVEGIQSGIEMLLREPKRLQECAAALKTRKFDNQAAIKAFAGLLG